MKFVPYPKIPRYSREIIITEKIDGTNASVTIVHEAEFEDSPYALECPLVASVSEWYIWAGSRNRFLTVEEDNFGFAKWVEDNPELVRLGPGTHHGEWWGKSIQRGYGLTEKRFSLFNVGRWLADDADCPECCHVVPVLYTGPNETVNIDKIMNNLKEAGSLAVEGYDNPEGICIFHTGSRQIYKKTFEGDEQGKDRSNVNG